MEIDNFIDCTKLEQIVSIKTCSIINLPKSQYLYSMKRDVSRMVNETGIETDFIIFIVLV
jgi:hypothetical protein